MKDLYNPSMPTLVVTGNLDRCADAVITSWIEQTRRTAHDLPAQVPIERMRALATDGLALLGGVPAGEWSVKLERFRRNLTATCLAFGVPIADLSEVLRELGLLAVQHATAVSAQDLDPVSRDATVQWWSRVVDRCIVYYAGQLEEHLRTSQSRSATLLRVANAVSSTLDLSEVLRTIQNEIRQVLDLSCNSFLINDHGQLEYAFTGQVDPEYAIPHPPENFNMDALRRKEPVYCYDAATDPRTDKQTVRFFGLKSLLAVPFIYRDEVVAVGLMTTLPPSHRRFSQDEIDLLQSIANTAASAIANARLHQKTELLAIAQERSRLAEDVHDNLIQTLTFLKMGLAELLGGELSPAARNTLQEMKDLVGETFIDMRDTIFGLSAFRRPWRNLSAELDDYAAAFALHHKLSIRIDANQELIDLIPGRAVMHVIRIIQESLVNVRKHADARRVWITVKGHPDSVEFTIRDDGCGFDPRRTDAEGRFSFGLAMMRTRAREAGGTLSIDSRPGKGTEIAIKLPLEEDS